jgi:hypothetical protein
MNMIDALFGNQAGGDGSAVNDVIGMTGRFMGGR